MTQKLAGHMVVLAGTNLVLNPSVEIPHPTQGEAWPANWNWSAANATLATDQAHTGSKSLRIQVVNAIGEWRADVFPVASSQSYGLRCFVKGTGSNQAFLTIRFWSDAGGTQFVGENNVSLEGSFADWTEKSSIVVAPANAVSADIMFRCPSNTTADIYGDDFRVRLTS